jgi:hypothetical protein
MKARSFIKYILLFFCGQQGYSQVLPAENDTLNYRLIGFSMPVQSKAVSYKLEIARGRINNQYDFEKNIIYTTTENDNRIIATVPEFGKTYTWRMSGLKKNGKEVTKGTLLHFHTGADTGKFRLKILTNKLASNRLLVFIDYLGALYDLDGRPVWYLPKPADTTVTQLVRDFKLTSRGTITYLQTMGNANAYEIDYNGNILWKAPNDGRVSGIDTSEFYHHEFTRLSNGNYLIVGTEHIRQTLPENYDMSTDVKRGEKVSVGENGEILKSASFGTLIEYDSSGNIVWSWKLSDQFRDKTQLFGVDGQSYQKAHLNGFEFDERNKIIYLSFRDLNSIWKISYPNGAVLAKYDGVQANGQTLFRAQHSPRLTKDGNILLFNNNSGPRQAGYTGKSYVTIISEPTGNESPPLIWDFACDMDSFARHQTISGGSVSELPDGSILACMGWVNRQFIVNRNKEVLWNAISEIDKGNGDWAPYGAYRAWPVQPEMIEHMIFENN